MCGRPCLLAILVAILIGCPLPVTGQEQTGAIHGTIRDTTGAVLPGATVEARSPTAVGVNTAVSDAEGRYRFPALPPGTYTVTAAAFVTFRSAKVDNAALAIGQLLTIDLTLDPASVSEDLLVTSESPLIDTTTECHPTRPSRRT